VAVDIADDERKSELKGCDVMNIKTVLMTFILLLALALWSCAGYAVYGYPDHPYYSDYGYYPYGYFSFHRDFGHRIHHFDGGRYEARHWGGRH